MTTGQRIGIEYGIRYRDGDVILEDNVDLAIAVVRISKANGADGIEVVCRPLGELAWSLSAVSP